MSVRVRLFALCTGLLLVLGGANLLLVNIIGQQQGNELIQQEQYRRVEIIYGTMQAVSSYRHWQGQVNTAKLVNDPDIFKEAEHSLDQARAEMERRLTQLDEFDAPSAKIIRKSLADLPEVFQKFVVALREKDSAAIKVNFLAGGAILNTIEVTLVGATERERLQAQKAQQEALARSRSAIRWSLLIFAISATSGLFIAALVLRSIVRPLQVTVGAMRQVNAGQTEIDLPAISNDEFGEMAVAIRQFREQTEQLRYRAYHDGVTGLGNRAKMEDSLTQAIKLYTEGSPRLGLFQLDLDGFGSVNNSLGHSAGDSYLREVASRLRRFTPEDSLVCRYSGDKFTVLVEAYGSEEDAHALFNGVAMDILRGLSEPYEYGGYFLPMSVSIGIAKYPGDGENGEQVLSSADAAMYRVKHGGRNNFQFATPELTGVMRKRLTVAADVRRGLERGEFEPFYQPIVDVERGVVIGAEALIRWRHPQRGVLGAHEFIDVAETTGLIHALGSACLQKVFAQSLRWAAQRPQPLRIAVNLSARQIDDGSVINLLRQLQAEHGGAVPSLDLEITESAMLEHMDVALQTLKQLKSMGYRLSVDDFGTGYSSLSYVQRFPIDKLKIDRSFVMRAETSREAKAIISATVALANSLDLDLVAEGVETLSQRQLIQQAGCRVQQGFLYSPALPAADFEAWAIAFDRTNAKARVA